MVGKEATLSTRSNIGIQNPDGTVTQVYCHFDGYPQGVGEKLLLHYTDRSKVERLIALGALSSLREEIGEKHSFHGDPGTACTAAVTHPNLDDLRANMQAYAYVLTADGWVFSEYGKPFEPLTDKVVSDDEQED